MQHVYSFSFSYNVNIPTDAIRARLGMQADKWEAVDTTDRYLGIGK